MAPQTRPAPATTPAHVMQDKMPDLSALLREVAEKTTQRYDAGRFAPKSAEELWSLAEDWYLSGLLPAAYYPKQGDRWAKQWRDQGVTKAVIVMRYGASLGVLPEQSVRQIYIVEGQPAPSAALMLSMAIAGGMLKREDWRIVEASRAKVAIELFGTTRGKTERVEAKFEDYKHLHHKDNWKNYPEDMLLARATSRAMRRYFPDVFAGVYAAEERVDMRQDRVAGRIEDPVERILGMADAPEEPTPEPPPAARAEDTADAAPPFDLAGLLADIRIAVETGDASLWPGLHERMLAAPPEAAAELIRTRIEALTSPDDKAALDVIAELAKRVPRGPVFTELRTLKETRIAKLREAEAGAREGCA